MAWRTRYLSGRATLERSVEDEVAETFATPGDGTLPRGCPLGSRMNFASRAAPELARDGLLAIRAELRTIKARPCGDPDLNKVLQLSRNGTGVAPGPAKRHYAISARCLPCSRRAGTCPRLLSSRLSGGIPVCFSPFGRDPRLLYSFQAGFPRSPEIPGRTHPFAP